SFCSRLVLPDFRPDIFCCQFRAVTNDVAEAVDFRNGLALLDRAQSGVELRHFRLGRAEPEIRARLLFGNRLVDGGLPYCRNGISEGGNRSDQSHIFEKRSEEHTSELQSLTNLVCRLLLEKKKKIIKSYTCTRTN